MFKLTAPDGSPIYIRETGISAVLHTIPDGYPAAARAVVVVDGTQLAVTETPEQIIQHLAGRA